MNVFKKTNIKMKVVTLIIVVSSSFYFFAFLLAGITINNVIDTTNQEISADAKV